MLLLEPHEFADIFILQIDVRAGLVQEVNGLVGQEAVGDIALRKHHGLPGNLRRDHHAVEFLIVMGNSADDIHGLLDGRLVHRDGLEAPLQGRILFNVLAVLIEGGSANDLNLTPGKGGL